VTATRAAPLAAPFRGLVPFGDSELDALLFFGRERETEIAVANLLAARLTILYGPSGVGKSSLLRAGVARRVRELGSRRAIGRGPDGAAVVFASWADDPVRDLAEAIADEVTSLVKRPVARPVPGTPLVDVVEHWTNVLDGSLYLVLDQLEEYFVYHEAGGPGTLEHELPEVVQRPRLRANVLLSLRDDALAQLDVFKARLPNLFANYLRLDRLDRAAATAAIVGPVKRWNELVPAEQRVEIEPVLVDAVLAQAAVAGEPDRIEPPYLQLVLERLWNEEGERGSRVLRASTLAELGGAEAIVREHLDRALAVLDEREQDAAALMFDHLVTPSGTKIAHRVTDLAQFAHVPEAEAATMLAVLGGERIVRPLDEGSGGGDRYEIFHDVLGAAVIDWQGRHQLAAERARARRRQRRLAAVALAALAAVAVMVGVTLYALTERSQAQKQTRVARAATADATQKSRALARSNRRLGHLNKALLVATKSEKNALESAQTAEANEAAANKNLQSALTAEKAATKNATQATQKAQQSQQVANQEKNVATGALKTSWHNLALQKQATKRANAATDRATKATKRADTAKQLADQQATLAKARKDLATAQEQLSVDPVVSVREALVAAQELPAASVPVLRDSLAAMNLRRVIGGGSDPIRMIALSPDNSRFVVAAETDGASVFDTASGNLIRRLTRTEDVNVAAYSPDGATIATAGPSGATSLWNATSGTLERTLPGAHSILTLAFSPDGSLVATGGVDQTVKVWNVATGTLRQRLVVPRAVLSVAFSPDGTGLLATDGDKLVRLYTLGRSTPVVLANPARVSSAHWSHDGSKIVTTTVGPRPNAVAILWDRNGTQLHVLGGHGSAVLDAAFSHDDKAVATASADDTSRVYDTATGDLVSTFSRHTGSIDAVAFSPDDLPSEQFVVTGSTDKTARIWDANDGFQRSELLGSPGAVTQVAYAGHDTVVTVSADGTVRIWNPHDQPLRTVVGRHDKPAVAVAFALGGTRIVSGSADGTAVIWPLGGGTRIVLRHGDAVNGVAVSSDGREVLTWSQDGSAALWSAATGKRLDSFPHGAPVKAAVLSSDGSLVATAGGDGSAKIWSTKGGALVQTLQQAGVDAVAFNPEGTLLASGGSDDLARIWRTSDWTQLGSASHQDPVTRVSFSPDGRFLATAAGNSAFVWSVGGWKQPWSSLDHTNSVNSINWSRDGTRLLTASQDGTAQLLDVESRRRLEQYHGHSGAVSQAVFSADGRWVATAGPITAGIWPTSMDSLLTDDRLFFVRGDGARVLGVAFSPIGWRIATADAEGSVRTYNCVLCGGLAQLVPLAHRRLAALGPQG